MIKLKELINSTKEATQNTAYAVKKTAYVGIGLAITSAPALAFTTPASSDPGYELYDLIINKGFQGPLGFIAGVWILAQAGTVIKESTWKGAATAVGGAALIKADTVLPAIGALVDVNAALPVGVLL